MVLKHYLQRSIANNIKNLYLQFQAWQRSNRNTDPHSGDAKPPKDYRLTFSDDFTEMDWDAWRTGHPWGRNVHTDWLWKWWPHRTELTKYQVLYPTAEGMAFELKNFKRKFTKTLLPKWQKGRAPDEWTGDYAMACISSRKTFKYGWFEAEIKVPTGKGQWAAFWLSGSRSWPPEIDIFETYGRKPGELWVKPNVHFGASSNDWRDGKRDFGQAKIRLKNPNQRFIKYAVHWTEDWIRFYYDGYLVQECTVPAALKQSGAEQYIILNNGCENPERLGFQPDETVMLVRNLRVYQQPE